MEQAIYDEMIVQYGTPLYVFDLNEMKQSVAEVRSKIGTRADLCYAMKANPFLTRPMSALVDRIEVCSYGEFKICQTLGIDPHRMLISGVQKKKEELYEIMDACGDQCIYTVESWGQFSCIEYWAELHQMVIPVYLRLSSGNQFGLDQEGICNILNVSKLSSYICIKGIHFYSGTQKKQIGKIQRELIALDVFLQKLEKEWGHPIEELEYGPGLSVTYFHDQENHLSEDLESLGDYLDEMVWRGKVTIELGRTLVAPCGYYFTRVDDVKQNQDQWYAIVDGGMHHLNYDGQIKGMYQPKFSLVTNGVGGTDLDWTVCGSLCTANDVLMRRVRIHNLHVGSILVFENVGAYAMTEGMSLFLSHDLPRIVFYDRTQGGVLVRDYVQTYQWNMED